MRAILLLAVIGMLVSAGEGNSSERTTAQLPDLAALKAMQARFAPTPLKVDVSGLSAGDLQALTKLIEASRIVNHIFMEQFWSGDLALYEKLQRDDTPLGRARLHYFWLNKGPWSEIDEHKAFIARRAGAQAAGIEFLSPGYDQGGIRNLGQDAFADGKRSGRGILHRHPAWLGPQTENRAVQRGVQSRSGLRRPSCCETRRRRPTTPH